MCPIPLRFSSGSGYICGGLKRHGAFPNSLPCLPRKRCDSSRLGGRCKAAAASQSSGLSSVFWLKSFLLVGKLAFFKQDRPNSKFSSVSEKTFVLNGISREISRAATF